MQRPHKDFFPTACQTKHLKFVNRFLITSSENLKRTHCSFVTGFDIRCLDHHFEEFFTSRNTNTKTRLLSITRLMTENDPVEKLDVDGYQRILSNTRAFFEILIWRDCFSYQG